MNVEPGGWINFGMFHVKGNIIDELSESFTLNVDQGIANLIAILI